MVLIFQDRDAALQRGLRFGIGDQLSHNQLPIGIEGDIHWVANKRLGSHQFDAIAGNQMEFFQRLCGRLRRDTRQPVLVVNSWFDLFYISALANLDRFALGIGLFRRLCRFLRFLPGCTGRHRK